MIRESKGRFLTLVLAPVLVVAVTALVMLPRHQSTVKVNADGPIVHIRAPQGNSRFSMGELDVVAEATDSDGLAAAELRIDGRRVDGVAMKGGSDEEVRFSWTPTKPGDYDIEVRARDLTGAWGAPAQLAVTFVDDEPALPPPPTFPATTATGVVVTIAPIAPALITAPGPTSPPGTLLPPLTGTSAPTTSGTGGTPGSTPGVPGTPGTPGTPATTPGTHGTPGPTATTATTLPTTVPTTTAPCVLTKAPALGSVSLVQGSDPTFAWDPPVPPCLQVVQVLYIDVSGPRAQSIRTPPLAYNVVQFTLTSPPLEVCKTPGGSPLMATWHVTAYDATGGTWDSGDQSFTTGACPPPDTTTTTVPDTTTTTVPDTTTTTVPDTTTTVPDTTTTTVPDTTTTTMDTTTSSSDTTTTIDTTPASVP